MTCRVLGGGVIVCGLPGVYRRSVGYCPVCDRRHGFVISWGGAWYGSTHYGSCGDRWQDGEMAPRPFERGWRKRAREHFSDLWRHAASRDLYDAYVRADIRFAIDDDWESAAAERDAVLAQIRRAS